MVLRDTPAPAVLSVTKGSRVWLFDPSLKEWLPGKLASVTESKCGVQLDNGDAREVDAKDTTVLPANPTLQDGVDDITQLSHLNQPAILRNLKHRFDREKIYTFAGPVLVAVNPFKDIELCSEKYAAMYRERSVELAPAAAPDQGAVNSSPDAAAESAQTPHIFLVAANAFQDMKRKDKSQALVISGESGAGKTESTKMAMQYFAGLSGGGGIEAQVLQSNPVLEAFGNAKTKRNHNSSRFGKLIQIHFTPDLHISGATVRTFLLEKSRVVKPQKDERSYHIFYQLIRGASSEERERLKLPSTPETLRYLGQSQCTDIAGVDDAANFQSVKRAMGIIGISTQEQQDLWTLLAGVLWLGNVEFEPIPDNSEEQHAQVAAGSEPALATAASLLGLEPEELRCALVTPKLRDRKNTTEIKKQLSVPDAEMSRDALAKAVYSGIFDWLVQKISSQLAAKQQSSNRCISILDIFGFEDFGHNSFEQLCINYANERLQSLFNKHLFKLEQEEYEREGLPWELVPFTDNQPVLDCLDINSRAHQGVLVILDEACKLSSNDQGFRDRMQQAYGGLRPRTKIIEVPKLAQKDWDFAVSHFAGTVKYSANSFTEKNKDKVGDALVVLMGTSAHPMVRHFANELGGTPGGSNMANKTVWSRFKVEMEQLMGILEGRSGRPDPKLVANGLNSRVKRVSSAGSGVGNGNGAVASGASSDVDSDVVSSSTMEEERPLASSGLHFVRCIKPNNQLRPGLVESVMFLEQLRWGGVVEVARIASRGFPTRYPVADFVSRYHVSIPGLAEWQHQPHETPQESCQRLLQQFGIDVEVFMVGKSKIFFRAGVLAKIEDAWSRLHKLSTRLQVCCTTWSFVTHLRKTQRAALTMQCCWRRAVALHTAEALRREKAAFTMQQAWRSCVARRQLSLLRSARCIQNTWRSYVARKQLSQLRSARCIQNTWRSYMARKELLQLRSARCIQNGWRCYMARKQLSQLCSARCIQNGWRSCVARKQLSQLRSALCIQQAWRGHCARRRAAQLRAAVYIQCSWRACVARQQFAQLKRNNAALCLQCGWRQHRARGQLLQLRQERAACVLQSHWRGCLARHERRSRAQNKAATHIQAAWRRLLTVTRLQAAVLQLLQRHKSSALVQRCWRYYRVRSKWLEVKDQLQDRHRKMKSVPDVEWVVDPIKTTRNMDPIMENGLTTPEASSTPTFSDTYSVRSEPAKSEPYETVMHRRLEAAVNSASYGPPGAEMRKQLMQRVATVAEIHCGDPYAQGFADCIVHLAEGSSRLEDELMNLEHMCGTAHFSPSDFPGLASRLADLQVEFKKFCDEFKGNIECIRDMTAGSMMEDPLAGCTTVDIVAECKLVKRTFALWEVEFEERLKEVKPVAMRAASRKKDGGVRGSADGSMVRLSWLGSFARQGSTPPNTRSSLFTS